MSNEDNNEHSHNIPAPPCYEFEMQFIIELVKSFLNKNECIVILKLIQGYTLVEIAKQNGWTISRVRRHRNTEREKLKPIKNEL